MRKAWVFHFCGVANAFTKTSLIITTTPLRVVLVLTDSGTLIIDVSYLLRSLIYTNTYKSRQLDALLQLRDPYGCC